MPLRLYTSWKHSNCIWANMDLTSTSHSGCWLWWWIQQREAYHVVKNCGGLNVLLGWWPETREKKKSQFLLTLTAWSDPVPKSKQNTRDTQAYKWKCEIRFIGTSSNWEKIRFSYCTFKPSLTRIGPEAFKKLTESSLLDSDIWEDKNLSGAFQDLYNRFQNTNGND